MRHQDILLISWAVPAVLLVALALSGCGQMQASTPAARQTAPARDLTRIAYSASTPMAVLDEGRAIFVGKMRPRENIQWNQVIVNFLSDEALVAWSIDEARQAGLGDEEAEKVIRYFLAFRHNAFAVDPCE